MCAVASAPGVPGAASVRVQHVMSRLTGGRDAATTRGARSCWLCSSLRAAMHEPLTSLLFSPTIRVHTPRPFDLGRQQCPGSGL